MMATARLNAFLSGGEILMEPNAIVFLYTNNETKDDITP
jgi:hypothetical protein